MAFRDEQQAKKAEMVRAGASGPEVDEPSEPKREELVTCTNCVFFIPDRASEEEPNGECHINPPVRFTSQKSSYWPTVKAADWCGQYNPRKRGTTR